MKNHLQVLANYLGKNLQMIFYLATKKDLEVEY